MADVEMSHIDLERGGGGGGGGCHPHSSAVDDGAGSDDGTVCFSSDEGSCCSQFYSTQDGSNDDSFASGSDHEIARRASWASESESEPDGSVDLEKGFGGIKVNLGKVERDCRICHLGIMESDDSESSAMAMELGCCCKGDLATAHKNCAETWFKIKGNRTCEICNSVANNVFPANENALLQQQGNEANAMATNAVAAPAAAFMTESRGCFSGHRLMNFLLACMVFAFLISWLFHFNIPS